MSEPGAKPWICSICGKPGRAHLDTDDAYYCIDHYELRMAAGSRKGMALVFLAHRLLMALDKIDTICEGTPRQPFVGLAELARFAIADGRGFLAELGFDEVPPQ